MGHAQLKTGLLQAVCSAECECVERLISVINASTTSQLNFERVFQMCTVTDHINGSLRAIVLWIVKRSAAMNQNQRQDILLRRKRFTYPLGPPCLWLHNCEVGNRKGHSHCSRMHRDSADFMTAAYE